MDHSIRRTDLITASNIDRLRSCNIVHIASEIRRSDILHWIVIRWATNIPRSAVSYALINIIDEDIGNGGVGLSHSRRGNEGENGVELHDP